MNSIKKPERFDGQAHWDTAESGAPKRGGFRSERSGSLWVHFMAPRNRTAPAGRSVSSGRKNSLKIKGLSHVLSEKVDQFLLRTRSPRPQYPADCADEPTFASLGSPGFSRNADAYRE
jgi:hypothetical protein